MSRILLVEDTPKLGQQVVDLLTKEGFDVTWAKTARAAREQDPGSFALVVLDLMLPDGYGLDVLKWLRERADTPVLILSARTDTADKVRGLKLGADDYMTKPFWPEELVARVRTRLRRPVLQRGDAVHVGPIEIHIEGRHVAVDGRAVDLTRAEFDFLAALARRPGQAVTRAQLAETVLDEDRDALERTLDSHVSRLRRKLGAAGKRVKTVWGVGYRLELGDDP